MRWAIFGKRFAARLLAAELKTAQERLEYVQQDNGVLKQEKANLAGSSSKLLGHLRSRQ